jgi:hypothetical protein
LRARFFSPVNTHDMQYHPFSDRLLLFDEKRAGVALVVTIASC